VAVAQALNKTTANGDHIPFTDEDGQTLLELGVIWLIHIGQWLILYGTMIHCICDMTRLPHSTSAHQPSWVAAVNPACLFWTRFWNLKTWRLSGEAIANRDISKFHEHLMKSAVTRFTCRGGPERKRAESFPSLSDMRLHSLSSRRVSLAPTTLQHETLQHESFPSLSDMRLHSLSSLLSLRLGKCDGHKYVLSCCSVVGA